MFKRLFCPAVWSLLLISLISLVSLVSLVSCGSQKSEKEQSAMAAKVFSPGANGNKVLFSLLNSGVRKAAKRAGIAVHKIKGDSEDSFWEPELLRLASSSRNTLIVSTGQRFAEVGNKVGESYPGQSILVLNAVNESGRITTVSFNQFEQAFILGYCAALISSEKTQADAPLKLGLVAYRGTPQLNTKIRMGFQIGMETIEPDAQLEIRLLEKRNNAEEAEKAAAALYRNGVHAILTLPGKQSKGVSAAARDAKAYVLLMNSARPVSFFQNTVLASTVIRQEHAAEFWTEHWISGKLEQGSAFEMGVSDSMIKLSLSRWEVPENVRIQMADLVEQIENGSLVFSNSNVHRF